MKNKEKKIDYSILLSDAIALTSNAFHGAFVLYYQIKQILFLKIIKSKICFLSHIVMLTPKDVYLLESLWRKPDKLWGSCVSYKIKYYKAKLKDKVVQSIKSTLL